MRIEVADGVVRVDGQDIAAAIRTPEIDAGAAAVARLPRVREVLIEQQRAMGAGGGVVMEGRDIGTVVFPNADVKVYLDASAEERARRRAHDPAHAAGRGATAVKDVATALEARDLSDRTRAASAARHERRRCGVSSIRPTSRSRTLFEQAELASRSVAVAVVFRRSGIELPPVTIAVRDLVGSAQLLVVLIFHAERLGDIVHAILIRRRVVAARRLVAN